MTLYASIILIVMGYVDRVFSHSTRLRRVRPKGRTALEGRFRTAAKAARQTDLNVEHLISDVRHKEFGSIADIHDYTSAQITGAAIP